MSTDQDTPDRDSFIRGLRELAEFLEQRPEMPVVVWPEKLTLLSSVAGAALIRCARQMGYADKVVSDGYFELHRRFGDGSVTFQLYAPREEVCERVVTGTREVVSEVPDPVMVAAVPKVRRVEVVEDVEWRCPDSLLSDAVPAGVSHDG